MSIDDLWYKNAVIYCLDVEKYQDTNGDGIGDFEGLSRRLDYLAGLGATCIWLQPFYTSPNRDNGYDVTDYYNVHEKHGSLGDFVNFMNRAEALGLRVIVDLVVNHSSIDCRWFREARESRTSPYRDWYIWADERPKDHREGIVFPGEQTSTWAFDRKAGQYTSIVSTTIRPTSIPGIRTCAPRSRESWASGFSSVCPASGWMPCRS